MKSFATIAALKALLTKKECTAAEINQFYQERIKKYNKELNALIEVTSPTSYQEAGALAGIPFATKDNISQKDTITSAGSRILKNYKAPYDATVITRLKQAGAYSLGRANMDEFAMGSTGRSSAYGPAKNPWNTTKTPGGSSSGSAAAVAAGLVPFALGTETGGSVRQPAAFCNLVGLYPTYGLHSRFGVIAFASSTDQVGPLTKTVYDNALVTSALAGHDAHDGTSLNVTPQDYTKGLDGKLPQNITIGVLKDGIDDEAVDPEIRSALANAVQSLEKMGATIKYISLPEFKYGVALYFIISRAEAASNLARFDGSLYGSRNLSVSNLIDMYKETRHEGFGDEVKCRILVGNYVLSAGHKDAYYNKAQEIRALLRQEFLSAFKEVDLIMSPTTSALPFTLGSSSHDAFSEYLADYFVVPNCIIGTPGLSVPAGFSREGLPIGIQFLGPTLSENLLFKVGHAFEQYHDYYLKHPTHYE